MSESDKIAQIMKEMEELKERFEKLSKSKRITLSQGAYKIRNQNSDSEGEELVVRKEGDNLVLHKELKKREKVKLDWEGKDSKENLRDTEEMKARKIKQQDILKDIVSGPGERDKDLDAKVQKYFKESQELEEASFYHKMNYSK